MEADDWATARHPLRELMGDTLPFIDATPAADTQAEDIGGHIDQFLNRWHWRGERAVVRAELVELLELATKQAAVDPHATSTGTPSTRE